MKRHQWVRRLQHKQALHHCSNIQHTPHGTRHMHTALATRHPPGVIFSAPVPNSRSTYSSAMIAMRRPLSGTTASLPTRWRYRSSSGCTATAVSPRIVSGRVVATGRKSSLSAWQHSTARFKRACLTSKKSVIGVRVCYRPACEPHHRQALTSTHVALARYPHWTNSIPTHPAPCHAPATGYLK